MSWARYMAAAHAMQSGVKFDIETSNLNKAGADPKHLRTGINSAMVNDKALVNLLIAKGLFTMEEYEAELVKAMQEEVDRYKKILEERLGSEVTLA